MTMWGRKLLAIGLAVGLAGVTARASDDSNAGSGTTVPAANASDTSSEASAEPQDNTPIRVSLWTYTWLSSLSSTVEVRDKESTSEYGFGDILKTVDFANFAHLEVQKGRWGAFSELDYVKLSGDTEFRNPRTLLPFKTEADGVVKQTMAELGVIRSFEGSRISLDALAGARYSRLASDVHAGPFRSSSAKDWVDPLVGARLRLQLSENWNASLRGDLAGFGAGSDLSTNIVGTVSYDISTRYVLGFGYRYFDVDFEKDAVDLSSTTQGPVMGIGIRF